MKIEKQYIYPPRPAKAAIPFEASEVYSRYGWKAQLKFSDKRCVICIDKSGVELFTRHDSIHSYTPPPHFIEEIRYIAESVLGLEKDWSLLDGGLLDGKNKLFSDTLVIWDILVREGEWLLGSTYGERYEWLLSRSGTESFVLEVGGKAVDFGIRLSKNIFIPRQSAEFTELWEQVQRANQLAGWSGPGDGEPLLEGIVYKDNSGTLEPGLREENNTSWCSRTRVRTGRHVF